MCITLRDEKFNLFVSITFGNLEYLIYLYGNRYIGKYTRLNFKIHGYVTLSPFLQD